VWEKPQISPLRCRNISTKDPLNRRSLGFARDDKGEGNGSIKSGCRTEAFFITLSRPQTNDPSVEHPLFMEPLPSPLSSRAKPRDLRFRGPFLEMFFSRAQRRGEIFRLLRN
jgi:hypothetical protein